MKRVLYPIIFTLLLVPLLAAQVPTQGFSEVVKQVSPAVVSINVTKQLQTGDSPFPFDEDQIPEGLRRYFEEFWDFDSPQPRYVPGSGSGLIFTTDGYVLTNNHVVQGADEVTVKLADGTEYSGKDVKLVGTDPETDLAVLKIKANGDLPAAELANSDEVGVGDWGIAIGNPYQLEHTVTVGVVSAKGRSNVPLYGGPSYQDFIQTDAAINPGNSGGPLCNIEGKVIGINTAIRTAGLVNSGIGFAIPSNMALDVADQLIEYGRISRGYIGIYLQEATPQVLEAMGIEDQGVFVSRVIEDSPADQAGLEPGDLITTFNGDDITSVDQLRWMAATTSPGTRVEVGIIRDGRRRKFSLKLAERPTREEMAQVPQTPEEEEPKEMESSTLGITVTELPEKVKEEYQVEHGVLVIQVRPGSLANLAGIRRGDVIVEVNKNPISNVRDMKRLKTDLEEGELLLFRINREGHTHFLTIRP